MTVITFNSRRLAQCGLSAQLKEEICLCHKLRRASRTRTKKAENYRNVRMPWLLYSSLYFERVSNRINSRIIETNFSAKWCYRCVTRVSDYLTVSSHPSRKVMLHVTLLYLHAICEIFDQSFFQLIYIHIYRCTYIESSVVFVWSWKGIFLSNR